MATAIAELCYRFAPGMVERQRGWIINVGSVAGLVPGSAGHTLYGAVKSLVIKFSQSLALELRPARRARHRALPGVHLQRIPRRERHAADR